jgi:NTP pyrophosphatase (non-canonical NTP hydrolase)
MTHSPILQGIRQLATEEALDLVRRERARQDAQWGQQDHPDGTWLLIALEELGEVAYASLNLEGCSDDNIIEELAQSAAVLVAWLEACLRRQKGNE